MQECLERGIHYICTADDWFKDAPTAGSPFYRAHFYRFKELIGRSAGCATSVLQFGMNPGLISILTKKALMEIVENDEGDFVAQNREELRRLVEEGNFALLAKELQVTALIEADLDTTKSDIEEDENTIYNTWNIDDFYDEMNDRAIIKIGTSVSLEEQLKELGVTADQIYFYDRRDGTLELDIPGKDLKKTVPSEKEIFTGCIDGHEELFSIFDYYTIRDEKGEIAYAPSVMFVYLPCNLAINSVYRTDKELYRKKKYHIVPITNDRMRSGTEAVGMNVYGKNFNPVYIGVAPVFDSKRIETPSVLEVSVTVCAALRYILSHPKEGILYPDHLDVNEILSYTGRFLPVTIQKCMEVNDR